MCGADYGFYTVVYGGQLAEAEYNRFRARAHIEIDNLTFGRAYSATDEDTITRVKMAECAVVDELSRTRNGVLASASNDGYSESYVTTRSARQRVNDAAARYLALTGLLFAGGVQRC